MHTSTWLSMFPLLALATPIAAADRPAAPVAAPYGWQGFYLEGFVGGVGAETAIRLQPGGRWLQDSEAPFLAAHGSPDLKASGFLGGFGIGYNQRSGRLVFGPQIDVAGTTLSTARETGPFPPYVVTGDVYRFAAAFRSDVLATVRGRIGALATDEILIFATGGLAMADLTYTNGYGNDLGPGLVRTYTPLRSSGTGHSLNVGWTLGGGVEWAIAPQWTVKAEYLHADLGDGHGFDTGETLFGVPQANGFFVRDQARLTENIGKLGLAYSLR